MSEIKWKKDNSNFLQFAPLWCETAVDFFPKEYTYGQMTFTVPMNTHSGMKETKSLDRRAQICF